MKVTTVADLYAEFIKNRDNPPKAARPVTATCSGRSCNQENLYDAPANTPDGRWMCTGCKLWSHVVGAEDAPETKRSLAMHQDILGCDEAYPTPGKPTMHTSIPRGNHSTALGAILSYAASAYIAGHTGTLADVHFVRMMPDGTEVFRIDWSDGPEIVEVRP